MRIPSHMSALFGFANVQEVQQREEIVARKEAMLVEKRELEMKKLRSSQIVNKVCCLCTSVCHFGREQRFCTGCWYHSWLNFFVSQYFTHRRTNHCSDPPRHLEAFSMFRHIYYSINLCQDTVWWLWFGYVLTSQRDNCTSPALRDWDNHFFGIHFTLWLCLSRTEFCIIVLLMTHIGTSVFEHSIHDCFLLTSIAAAATQQRLVVGVWVHWLLSCSLAVRRFGSIRWFYVM